MAKYNIECTMIYNGYMSVEAEDEELAMEIAQKQLSSKYHSDFPSEREFGGAHFTLGEVTADYVESCSNELK